MANTYPNVTLKKGIWTNLYTAISEKKGSTVPVGTAIGFTLCQRGLVYANVGAATPTDDSGFEPVTDYGYVECEAGDPGLYAMAPFGDVTINIKEV